jgi:hypothetical protein
VRGGLYRGLNVLPKNPSSSLLRGFSSHSVFKVQKSRALSTASSFCLLFSTLGFVGIIRIILGGPKRKKKCQKILV